jgi:hypothetical protein
MISLTDLSQRFNFFSPFAFVQATSDDKLYYTNSDTHTVTCCDLHGTTQWEFNDEHVLQGPRGISVDP